jgi:hypothetical protein
MTLNSTVCLGYREKDERIWTITNCPIWKPEPQQWTVSMAFAFANNYKGIPLSRPTIIKMCKTKGIGRQIGKQQFSRWLIDPLKFKKTLDEEDE